MVPDVRGPHVDFVLPSWVPGSYWIQDPARSVRDVAAWTKGRTAPLPVERVEKARWRVATSDAEAIELTHTVYGHQLITEALDVTDDHLFVNAGFCLPYVDGRANEPCEIALDLPPGWRAYAELPDVGSHPPTFRAEDYDALVDAPIDCGTPLELGTTARGIPHRILLCGAGGNFEAHRLEADLGAIAEATIDLLGGSPLRRYTFFCHLNEISDGALEHRGSVSFVMPRTTFRPASAYRWFLRVSAHEYFHLYNVKRIRPKVFDPIDYTREVYTRLLWAMEGLTDYYAYLLLRRAGLVPPSRTLTDLAGLVRQLLATPGRAVTSLELASLQAWVDLYRPYEESPNQSVSYYLKGTLVSLCLDLELRHRSENRRSLDDVVRHLYAAYGVPRRGLGEDEFPAAVEAATGVDVRALYDALVRTTEEIDFGRFLAHAGLELREKPKPPGPDDDEPAGYLGIEVEERRGLARIARVLDGGPGRRDGLSPGDEIVAFNNVRVRYDEFASALARFPAGSDLAITVFRRGYLTTVRTTPGTSPPEAYEIVPRAEAGPLEKAVYEGWLKAPWTPPKAPG